VLLSVAVSESVRALNANVRSSGGRGGGDVCVLAVGKVGGGGCELSVGVPRGLGKEGRLKGGASLSLQVFLAVGRRQGQAKVGKVWDRAFNLHVC
jgi:hypothetical protein